MLHSCSLVDLLKMGNMDLPKSFAEAPIFMSPINPHKRSHMSACGQANDRGQSRDHRQSSYNHRHELTGRSLGQCLRRENMNVTACRDLRSQLQQNTSAILKKCFCFISPPCISYHLICIINRAWRCPHVQPLQWFLLLGFLSWSMITSQQHSFIQTVNLTHNIYTLVQLFVLKCHTRL